MCGGVHPLVGMFVCSVARGGDDTPITSVPLRSVGVRESGKDGGDFNAWGNPAMD